jgi:hypothetical protein
MLAFTDGTYLLSIRKHMLFGHYIVELRDPDNIAIHEQRFESMADACGFAERLGGGTFQVICNIAL